MKTITRTIGVFSILIVFIAMMAGCAHPALETPWAPEAGILRVVLDGDSGRTLLPKMYEVSSLYYTLAFTALDGPALQEGLGPVNGTIAIGDSSGEFVLAAGTWGLEVRGFVSPADATDPANVLVSGSADNIVISGDTGASINVTLIPDESKLTLTQIATGTLTYDIRFPAGVTQANLAVYDDTGAIAALGGENPVNLLAANTGSITLDSGVYDLAITLYMSGAAAVTGATAHIYDDLVTTAVYNFAEADFAEYAVEAITGFTLNDEGAAYTGRIDQAARTITVFVPPVVSLSSLTVDITHTGLLVVSNPATPDFADPVTYTVTLEDGVEISYTVLVSANEVSTVAALNALLSGAAANTSDTPLQVKISGVDLADSTDGWAAMLSAINGAGKYVDLDLSDCAMTNTQFDPGTADTGEKYLTGLVLPNAATSVTEGTSDAPTFRYFTSLKTLSASGVETVGGFAFYGCTSLETVSLPVAASIGDAAFADCTSLKTVFLPQATSIGYWVFEYCTGLETVSLPQATSIGGSAFYGCTSLETVSLPVAASIEGGVFSGCVNLTNIYVDPSNSNYTARNGILLNKAETALIAYPSARGAVTIHSVTRIIRYAFLDCTDLETVSLPQATSIGDAAFSGCTGLETVDLPVAARIEQYTFDGCTALETVDLPQATYIGDAAFRGCTGLETVSLPMVTSIGYGVFSDCTGLETVSLPQATSIGQYAFSGCTGLKTVSLPQAASIEQYTFDGCTALETVDLSVATSIGRYAFRGCTALETVSLPQATSIVQYAFRGCTGLETVDLLVATSIGDYAFSDCTSLETISLPMATSIGQLAFYDCTSLETVSLPQATDIGYNAFVNCDGLKTVSLPAAASIGVGAFYNCVSLETVSLPAVTSIGPGAFGGAGTTGLTVTLGSAAPTVGRILFETVSSAKAVTVLVPSGAMGYGAVPAAYTGSDSADNWGNAFRGKGWDGTDYGSDEVNSNISLTIDYITP